MGGKVLEQLLLRFRHQAKTVRSDISAIARTPDGHLWIGSDELTSIERLSATDNHEYSQHQQYALSEYLDLRDTQSEVDIEGLDYSDGYLWLVGSHSSKRKRAKGKDAQQDIQRLLKITQDANRYLLGRIPLVNGEPVVVDDFSARSAASLRRCGEESELIHILREDEHIGPFLEINLPSKDNGFDIEALAARGHQLFLGLRGPVLRGMAIILEIEVEASEEPGVLQLKQLENNRKYRKHFVDLNGLGVRDLCFQGEDLIVLAGPTMQLSCPMQLFRFRQVFSHCQDTLWLRSPDTLIKLFDLPWVKGADNAEGITLFPNSGSKEGDLKQRDHRKNSCETGLLVVYDSPSDQRLKNKGTAILADVFQLPLR
ncbi:MAG: DUF3616 domain-containing protein [Cyanobacteria bacterium J06621_11]